MRHERISQANVAAAWPRPIDAFVPSVPLHADTRQAPADAAPAMPTPAVPDVAAGVGGLIVAAYLGLILTFFAFFAGSLESIFAISIAIGFVGVFFAVPRVFFSVEPDSGRRRPAMHEFMHRGMDTLTGHSSGRDALVQMLIVPVLLTFSILAMGIAATIYL